MSKEKIFIFDTTMRDGEQSPGASMSLEEKIQIARVFDDLGVDIVEAGIAAWQRAAAANCGCRARRGVYMVPHAITTANPTHQ